MPTFIFAGGGTGGHLYPGLAIAERLREAAPQSRFLFLCSNRPIDAQILSAENVDFHAISARPFSLRPRALAKFVSAWGGAVRDVRSVIRREKSLSQVVMIAMGGFVAAPAAQAARAERVPLALVNLDVVPGKANRWIARRADLRLAVAGARGFPAWEPIAPIVRAAALSDDSPGVCRKRFGLAPDRPTLFVTGGSQGAGSINALVLHMLRTTPQAFAGWQVIHQTGATEHESVDSAYRAAATPAVVRPFLDEMGAAWRAADVAMSRCGAGSVAEAWANQTPALFLPYPYHRDEHQRWNAQPLVEIGGALVERDLVDPQANMRRAGAALTSLLSDRPRLSAMAAALERLGPADGARDAAARILALAR